MTTTHEDSIFESETDVEPASDEQQEEDLLDPQDDTGNGFDKFAMKTNNKINSHSQALKDERRLNSFLLRGMKAKDIVNQDPEFAKRLSNTEEYSELFSFNEDFEEENPRFDSEKLIKDAVSDLVIDGKRLSLKDRQLLKENKTFSRYLNGFVLAGDDPEVAAYKAFKEAYPTKSNMVETSFLSASSESTAGPKKETTEDKFKKGFSNPDSFPPFLRKRMGKK